MISRSCIVEIWKNEQIQIDKALLQKWVSN